MTQITGDMANMPLPHHHLNLTFYHSQGKRSVLFTAWNKVRLKINFYPFAVVPRTSLWWKTVHECISNRLWHYAEEKGMYILYIFNGVSIFNHLGQLQHNELFPEDWALYDHLICLVPDSARQCGRKNDTPHHHPPGTGKCCQQRPPQSSWLKQNKQSRINQGGMEMLFRLLISSCYFSYRCTFQPAFCLLPPPSFSTAAWSPCWDSRLSKVKRIRKL